jgi:hypothetical protein
MLTKRSVDILLRIENMMEKATRALATNNPPAGPARGAAATAPDAVASASGREPPKVARRSN